MIQASLCGRLLNIRSKKRTDSSRLDRSEIKLSSNFQWLLLSVSRRWGKSDWGEGFHTGQFHSQTMQFKSRFLQEHVEELCMWTPTHMYVCIVGGCWQREGSPCSQAGARRLVGLRTQHIHKSGLSGSCQRLHNEGHYSGRVSKLLSQGPVPGNHTHSAPC